MQYWLPDVGIAQDKSGKKPKWKLEYTTLARAALHPEAGPPPFPLKELPKPLREPATNATTEEEVKAGEKYMPYGLDDLTLGSWLGLARRLGDESGAEAGLRKQFRRYMYQAS